jgi:hypothetical protein
MKTIILVIIISISSSTLLFAQKGCKRWSSENWPDSKGVDFSVCIPPGFVEKEFRKKEQIKMFVLDYANSQEGLSTSYIQIFVQRDYSLPPIGVLLKNMNGEWDEQQVKSVFLLTVNELHDILKSYKIEYFKGYPVLKMKFIHDEGVFDNRNFFRDNLGWNVMADMGVIQLVCTSYATSVDLIPNQANQDKICNNFFNSLRIK